MRKIESEREEMRIRTIIKSIVEESLIHPDLLYIPAGTVSDDINFINPAGVHLITDKIYKLMVNESNE